MYQSDDPGMSPGDFQPRPGGLVDTARKEKAKLESAFHEKNDREAQVEAAKPRKVNPVTVKIRQPDDWGARTVTLAVGASQMAMPADPCRKRGKINLLGTTGMVLIAKDRSAADSGTGYVLQAGQPPEEFEHTREVWLNNNSSAAIQVSVFTETYSKE